jgi:hypothetical protein
MSASASSTRPRRPASTIRRWTAPGDRLGSPGPVDRLDRLDPVDDPLGAPLPAMP